jgi:hypothetical protein
VTELPTLKEYLKPPLWPPLLIVGGALQKVAEAVEKRPTDATNTSTPIAKASCILAAEFGGRRKSYNRNNCIQLDLPRQCAKLSRFSDFHKSQHPVDVKLTTKCLYLSQEKLVKTPWVVFCPVTKREYVLHTLMLNISIPLHQ